ncbi:MAG: hypothetical protein J6U54_08555 [Clostridiales bacterium]|nr:hypothetical protein [Clostridiales bacterium]
MEQSNKHLVEFEKWCGKCSHNNKADIYGNKPVCHACQERKVNEDSHIPVNYDGPRPDPVKGRRDTI